MNPNEELIRLRSELMQLKDMVAVLREALAQYKTSHDCRTCVYYISHQKNIEYRDHD